jgi:hypothetical protein
MTVDSQINALRNQMKKISGTMWEKEKDTMFFMYLDRLANAEKLKETDRIDGRTALNDFILEKESIVHTQQVRKSELLKKSNKESMQASK